MPGQVTTHWPECWRDHDLCAIAKVEALEHGLAAARAEERQLREALLHRCAVKEIEDGCPECLQIIAVLDDTTATPAPSAQEVSDE
jgi:hypothetical protein